MSHHPVYYCRLCSGGPIVTDALCSTCAIKQSNPESTPFKRLHEKNQELMERLIRAERRAEDAERVCAKLVAELDNTKSELQAAIIKKCTHYPDGVNPLCSSYYPCGGCTLCQIADETQ